MRIRMLVVVALASVLPAAYMSSQQPAINRVDFFKEVLPILTSSCYECHSGSQPKAGLRLDVRSMALKGGSGGVVILPGNSRNSRLIDRVGGLGSERQMPLGKPPLDAEKISVLARWIDQGATWPDELANEQNPTIQRHWAYVKPVRPALPAVRNTAWVRNPIDSFVLSRLEQEGLSPAPEADRETLIRRLSLDLIGLPPSPAEVDFFLSDRRPDAYERLVDRLLASPHHGERWATPWLDLARYGDSNGYTGDDRRDGAYPYRDWVINAFNQNMPFNQFTVEQIAGDLLPDATNDQKVATGFVRASMLNTEGGIDREEQNWVAQLDRASTVGTAFLGSTLGCAQCHNHKFDPFLQKDFYAMVAFFNNAKFGRTNFTEATVDFVTTEQASKRNAIQAEIKQQQDQLDNFPNSEQLWKTWERSLMEADAQWQPLHPTRVSSTEGSTFHTFDDGFVLVDHNGKNPDNDTYVVEAKSPLSGEITGIQIEAKPHPSLPRNGPGRDYYGSFEMHRVDVAFRSASGQLTDVPIKEAIFDEDINTDIRAQDLTPQVWKIEAVNDTPERLPRRLVLIPDKPFRMDSDGLLTIRLVHNSSFIRTAIGHFRVSVTTQPNPKKVLEISKDDRPLLGIPPEQRPKVEVADKTATSQAFNYRDDKLFGIWREIARELAPLRDKITELSDQIVAFGIPAVPVLAENTEVAHPSTQLRIRGAYTDKADEVFAAVPGFLGSMPKDGPQNRLGLAQWLVGAENPLTARVRMNQIWETYFGRGIVETSEDFGTQGTLPSHPELLDWLATEFIAGGWDQKAMHRLIVTSNTYRQSSKVASELLKKDPKNVLLARGPRYRVEAEMVRDVTLAASGLLSSKIGGPPVMPFQPDGLWNFPSGRGLTDRWKESEGEDRYRRGIYTFIRRTVRYPSLMVFDAPSREVSIARRSPTNTPLQALTTFNDPAFFEAARAMAQRILNEGGANTSARVVYGFRLATSRRPQAQEMNSLIAAFENARQRFERDGVEAQAVAGKPDPELAAWTVVSNALLNLDETLTKE